MHPASIEKVGIRGNRQISEERIRSYIRTRPGQSYDEAPLDSDIGVLYRTNFFDYLDIEEMDGDTGKIITFILEEKPLIRSKEDADLSSALLKTKVPPASIERIEIRGNRRISQERILSCIRTRPGQPYSQAQLVSNIGALYRTNFFDYLDIEERDGNTGKIITFILKEKPLIRTIEYKGNESFTEADILAAFRKNKVELSVDSSSYEPRKVRAAEGILKELMIQHGKPQGTVRTEVESIPSLSVRLRFILNESGKALR
jgi:outer membrane protein assembly factor BamA